MTLHVSTDAEFYVIDDFLQLLIWKTKPLRNEALSQCEQITREVEKTSTDDMTMD